MTLAHSLPISPAASQGRCEINRWRGSCACLSHLEKGEVNVIKCFPPQRASPGDLQQTAVSDFQSREGITLRKLL